jgi:hypothetical protein
MKNIHILPTDKPSRFYSTARTLTKKRGYAFGEHYIPNTRNMFSNHNIYITSDEEIKEGDWVLDNKQRLSQVLGIDNKIGILRSNILIYVIDVCKKIILTTDQELIKDGVQAIDDEFLEWFVKNPNCDEIEFEKFHGINTSIAEVNAISGDGYLNWEGKSDLRDYKIIIPKEEPKQETLLGKTISKKDADKDSFEDVTKYKIERSYSEEEVYFILCEHTAELFKGSKLTLTEWFEKFKKK